MPLFAIRVTWPDGSDEFLREGISTACFHSRRAAEEQIEFMRMGMGDEDVQAIVVVPYPRSSARQPTPRDPAEEPGR